MKLGCRTFRTGKRGDIYWKHVIPLLNWLPHDWMTVTSLYARFRVDRAMVNMMDFFSSSPEWLKPWLLFVNRLCFIVIKISISLGIGKAFKTSVFLSLWPWYEVLMMGVCPRFSWALLPCLVITSIHSLALSEVSNPWKDYPMRCWVRSLSLW